MNYFKLKFLLLFFALAVAIPPAWAETATLPNTQALTTDFANVGDDTHIQIKTSSENSYTNPLRIYANTTVTIKAVEGYAIQSVTYEASSTGNYVTYAQNATVTPEVTPTVDGKNVTWTFGDNVTEFTFTPSTQTRANSITITYYATGGSSLTPVTISFPENSYTATLGEAFTAPTLSVDPAGAASEVTYSSSNTGVAMVDEETGAITLVAAGTTTITAEISGSETYNNATASYTLTVEEAAQPGIITDFKETFKGCDGSGGNDNSWSGSIASSDFNDSKADNAGWELVSGNAANECIKLGTSSKKGSATTPSIVVTPGTTYTLKFKAAAWDGNKENTTLILSATGGTISPSSVTLTKGAWTEYNTITFVARENSATITFAGQEASNSRFFLDEVRLTHDQNATPVTVVAKPEFSVAGGTYTEAQSVEISCATEDATIYYTTDGSEPTASSTEYTGAISINETTTLKAIAVKDGQSSAVAEATYTIKTVTSVANLQAANALDDDTEFIYTGEAVVVWRDGNQMWLQDPNANVGGALVYGNVVSSFSSKDKLKSGWTAKKGTYNNASQFTEFSAEKDGNQDASPFERTSISAANVHEYVILKGVSISSDKKLLTFPGENGSTLTVYDKFNKLPKTINATSTYDIDGIIVLYGGNAEIYPLGCEEHTAAVVEVKAPEFTYNNEAITGSSVEVNANDKITITSEEGTTLIYTTDGSNPSESATALMTDGNTAEVTITEACTIKAVALDGDANESEVATLAVTISEPVQPGERRTYQKVTSTGQLTEGKYLIVYNGDELMDKSYALDGGLTELDAVKNTVEVTIDGDQIQTDANAYFTIKAFNRDGSYSIQSASGKYIGQTSNGNGLQSYDTELANAITIDGDDNADIVSSSAHLRYNASSGNERFRYFKSSTYANQQPIQLYKEVTGDVPVVPELSVALDPAEKTYTVGDVAKIMITVENGNDDTMVTYKINGEEKDYDAETGIVLPNDKAKKYTVEVYATDGDREATATGTYNFTAAPAFEITLTPNKEGNYTVGENAVVTVAVDKYIDEDYLVTYTIGDSEEQIEYNAETGIVLPNDKAGDVTVNVYVTDGYDHEGEGTATATYHFDAAPAIVVTLDPASGNYYLGEEVKVTVTAKNTIGDYEMTYKIGDGDELDYEDGITITSDQEGTVNLTVTVADGYHDGVATATGAYTFAPRPVVAMPTFSLVAGSYTGPQTVTIYCATEDATISYSTDGGQTWTKGNTVNVDKDMTIMAKAEKDGMTVSTTASATYVIITEETPETVNIETGYYQIKNLGNGLYANVAGRKTLNFTNAPADKAGTVIYVDVENDGTVKSLRSQAADLQRYADRAMSYVPEVVKIVAKKLNADGSGEILGETGLGKILDKFNECFDHNLHVEQAQGGYRLYGKTPSMQPVVEFYRENKDKVEAKLPNLEAFINSALEKLKAKIGGSSVFTEFKLHDIWDKMGGTLTEPVDAASTMAFYREVLNNKNYVWDFAYQTAMIYVNNLMNHPRWSEVEEQLGEYAQYIDKIKQIRPEFKYYIVQKDGKPDFISEGNKDIIDNAERTIWTLEPRTGFTVNFPEANKHNGEYVTTLYTDFAYTLPEGVTAYTVASVENGVAKLEALSGVIPAQTPVLLKSTAAGNQTVTLSTEAGTAPADNLLVGPDYLIKTYEIKTPQVEKIFEIIQNKLPGFYEEYVAQYEYLMLKTAGTVGNKYFWGLNKDEIIFDNNCVVRSLDVQDGTVAFYDNATVSTNKAFLVDDANNPQDVIKLSLRGDINKDGVISITDVTALIDILLDLPAWNYLEPTTSYPKGLDYEAADVNENKDIEITDVTTLIDILLNMPDQPAQGSGN